MAGLEQVFERIDGFRDQVIRIQKELTCRVALGPDNGGSGEHEKTGFIKGMLEALNPHVLKEIKALDQVRALPLTF